MKTKKLISKIIFKKEVAIRLTNMQYYKAQALNMRQQDLIDKAKAKLSTPRWETITKRLDAYQFLGSTVHSSAGKVLIGIYKRQVSAINNGST